MVLRAAFAFFIAFSMLHPERVAAYSETLGLSAAKAQLKAEHPSAQLAKTITDWVTRQSAAAPD